MKKELNPKMIVLACNSRGMNLKSLASQTEIEASYLSKIINGVLKPRLDIIEKVANVLEYPLDFFTQEINVLSPGITHYRKLKSLTSKSKSCVEANLFIRKYILKKLLNSVDYDSEVCDLNPYLYGSPEKAAIILRKRWGVTSGRIENMVDTLENSGVFVLQTESNDEKFSGQMIPDEDGVKVIYVNKNHPPDRQRFTLAHELGHLVMHNYDYIPNTENEAENEANRFASEFLMPEVSIAPHLIHFNIDKLVNLKEYWKCSIASLITRAYQLNLIDANRRTSLYVQMSQRGWNKVEPECGIKAEIPKAISMLFDLHSEELKYDDDDFAKTFNMYKSEVKKIREFYSLNSLRAV